MKSAILLVIFALVVQYISDFTFVYQSNRGTWLAGRINDLSYLTAYFLMTTAMIRFIVVYKKLRSPNATASPAAKEKAA